MNVLNQIDAYKIDHRSQYPDGTTLVFSNLTPRSSRWPDIDKIVFFGLQKYLVDFLYDGFNEFFAAPKDFVVYEYKRRVESFGLNIDYDHIAALHDLGYLPIEVRALPEGTLCPIGVPPLVLWNTHPDFFWLTNYLETSLSAMLWGPITSATIAREYRKLLVDAAHRTGGSVDFVDFQAHDFSMRGMYGIEAAAMSGAGHLLSFNGTDTLPAVDLLERLYGDGSFIGGSVPATEHSVMCMGEEAGEYDTIKRLITKVYPNGIVSIVSDTWDYWHVLTSIASSLKAEIMGREGTLTFRPDSGDPVKIIVGDPAATPGSAEHRGSFEVLWDTFGGTITDKGYKQLDPHVNLIYGDSITVARCAAIIEGLMAKGFVPSMIFGVGSYTYQYNTRDTFGMAMKATYGEVNGVGRNIFKNPKTDRGDKKSAKGLLAVNYGRDMGRFDALDTLFLEQEVEWEEVRTCAFELRFRDGKIFNEPTLTEIRNRVRS